MDWIKRLKGEKKGPAPDGAPKGSDAPRLLPELQLGGDTSDSSLALLRSHSSHSVHRTASANFNQQSLKAVLVSKACMVPSLLTSVISIAANDSAEPGAVCLREGSARSGERGPGWGG